MSKMRVYEYAKKQNISSKEIISKLKEMMAVKGMPKRTIKRAIKIAEKKLKDF